jgi:hypothetical protein
MPYESGVLFVKPTIKIEAAKDSTCLVRVGPIVREDPDSEIHIVAEIDDNKWERVIRRFVDGKKVHKFPGLKEGNYHIMAVGDKIASIATTAGHKVPFPFNVFLETHREHAKDFLKLSIPAHGKPLPPSLEAAIKASFKEKGT